MSRPRFPPVISLIAAPVQQAGRLQVGASGEIIWISGPSGPSNHTSLDTISFWTV
jgi:hypothetical protein